MLPSRLILGSCPPRRYSKAHEGPVSSRLAAASPDGCPPGGTAAMFAEKPKKKTPRSSGGDDS